MSPAAHAIRNCLVWLFGAVLVPFSLIGYLVLVKRMSFHAAVGHGELFAMGVGLAGASAALETILSPGRLATNIYQLGLLLLLIANVLMFAGTTEIRDRQLVTSLDSGEITTSVVLVALSVFFGIGAVARQTWQQATR